MIIQKMHLSDFRNYRDLSLDLNPGINIFYGNNAQGKTNFLEAAYLCGTTKSHRGTRDRDMIRFGCEEAHVTAKVEKQEHAFRIDLHLRKNKPKSISVDHMPVKRASDLFGILNIVFFSPEDLNIIKDGPSERRRFMDRELCQLDRIYLDDLKKYNRILEQRNQLLRDLYGHPDLAGTLDVWDQQLISYGKRVIDRRKEFALRLNEIAGSIHQRLTTGTETMTVKYEPSADSSDLEERISSAREKDVRFAQTSFGPHRDDLKIESNGIDMRRFGSQGQQRTCALSLKLSEIRLVEEITGEKPVLMLDDVLSELDRNRQDDLLNGIEDTQTLMTCTGIDDITEKRIPVGRIFYVENGTIK